jgi:hypothetical protein
MNDIGWGLLLNLLFWVAVATATVFALAWVSVKFFFGTAHQVRNTARAWGGRKDSPNPSMSRKDSGHRYRKDS